MRARLGTAMLVLVLLACVEPAGPEDRFGQVRLRASFAAGETPADFGVAVESIQVRISREGETAPLVDTTIAYVEDEASSWVLDLLQDEEELTVAMELRGAAALLYQGDATVTARAGQIGETEVQGVPVLYRGPAPIDRVVVSPATATITAIGGQLQLQASALARDGSVLPGKTFAWATADAGVASVDGQGAVRAIREGVTTITATVDGVSGSATVTVSVAADAINSTIDAAPDTVVADGMAAAVITVRLLDANGNQLGRSGGTVTLATTLGTLSPVTDHQDGTYTATLTGTVPGDAVIAGELDGSPIEDQAIITFRTGPASPGTASIVAQPDSAPADGVFPVTIAVRLFDANGNPLTTSGGTVLLSATLGTLSTVTDHQDGHYTATLTSDQAGAAVVTGTLNGVPLLDDALVTFLPGTASPAHATVTASPASAPADGSTAVTLTVRLFDSNGNPLTASGGTVVLGTTLGTLTPVTDHDDGSYTASLSSSTTGTALVSGFLNGVPLADTATVDFTAGPASPVTSTLRADPRRLKVGESTTIVVRLFDAQGRPLTTGGGVVTLATTLGTLGPVVDMGDGTYRATLMSSTPGRAVLTGAVNGVAMRAGDDVWFVP